MTFAIDTLLDLRQPWSVKAWFKLMDRATVAGVPMIVTREELPKGVHWVGARCPAERR